MLTAEVNDVTDKTTAPAPAPAPARNSLVHSLISDGNTARVKAQADYDAIIHDPTRTSDQDKAALAAAMKILAKTPNDVIAEQDAVLKSRELAEAASGHADAVKQIEDADAAFATWWKEQKPALLAAIEAKEQTLRTSAAVARTHQAKILTSLYQLRRHRLEHLHHAAPHLAKDPAGSPEQIYIRGTFADPAAGITWPNAKH
jgi:hypothetical protein